MSGCSDANRIATIVASIRGRAKWGLQDRSLFSKLIRTLRLECRLVFVLVEEVIKDEVVKDAVVVTIHMIKVKIEVVGGR